MIFTTSTARLSQRITMSDDFWAVFYVTGLLTGWLLGALMVYFYYTSAYQALERDTGAAAKFILQAYGAAALRANAQLVQEEAAKVCAPPADT